MIYPALLATLAIWAWALLTPLEDHHGFFQLIDGICILATRIFFALLASVIAWAALTITLLHNRP